MRKNTGFSLIELMVAVAIVGAFAAGVAGLIKASHDTFATQPEASDMQQRLRVAVNALHTDLLMAGAGAYAGATTGPLSFYFAPVLPYRVGSDAPGTVRADAITLVYVDTTSTQASLSASITSSSTTFSVNSDPGCPLSKPACGFAAGDSALVYDAAGHFDTFTITAAGGGGGTMTPDNPAPFGSTTYLPGARMVKATIRGYAIKRDASGQYQLVSRDGAGGADVPVIDHLVSLSFDYLGDPQPPRVALAGCDTTAALCTSYGPAPPPVGVETTTYPPGENCAFARDVSTGEPIPRGATFDAVSDSPVLMTPAQLTDGPWCPDASTANRFDLDLLRIRTIAITLRVESAIDALRGPSGALFERAGTATAAAKWLRDRELRLRVSPRNLNALP